MQQLQPVSHVASLSACASTADTVDLTAEAEAGGGSMPSDDDLLNVSWRPDRRQAQQSHAMQGEQALPAASHHHGRLLAFALGSALV